MTHSVRRHVGRIVFAASTLLLTPAVTEAQLLPVGGSTPLIGGFPIVRGTDTAFDPVHRVFIVVSAYGPVNVAFVNEAGAPLTAPIPLSGGFGQYPRVAFSPHVFNGTGGFLVTWHQGDGPVIGTAPSNQVHGRLIAYGNPPQLGPDTVIGTSPLGTWWEAAPAVAYSTTSQQFMVAWQQFAAGEIHAVRVGVNGAPIGTPFVVSDTYARDPGVAWNPFDNEFGISYSGANQFGASVTLARVSAQGAVLKRTIFFQGSATYVTDIAFNLATRNYVVAYSSPTTRTTELTAAGDFVSHGLLYSPVGSYDGLSMAYNLISGSHLLVGHYTAEVGGLELDGTGAKIGVEAQVTYGPAQSGSFYPRVSSSSVQKMFQISYSRDLGSAASQLLSTGAALVPPPTDTDADGTYDYIDNCPQAHAQTSNGCPPPGAQLGDVNGDSKPDILFQHGSTGLLYSFFMSNAHMVGESLLNPTNSASTDTLVVSKDDFSGDGLVDYLFQNQTTGALSLWIMHGTQRIGGAIDIPVVAGAWRVVATPDLNLDGDPDFIWQKNGTGELYAWFLRWSSAGALTYLGGSAFVESTTNFPIFGSGTDWKLAAAGDINSDGHADVIFQNQVNGNVVAWFLSGPAGVLIIHSNVVMSTSAGAWRVRMANDLNQDGTIDLVWQHSVTANPLLAWYLDGSAGIQAQGYLLPTTILPPLWRVVGGK